jgi:hypothetical protein
VRRAVAATTAIASSLDLAVDDVVLLNVSNKLALRLLPGDVMARVALDTDHVVAFEIELAQRLAAFGSPVARLDPRVEPRVYERDGFAVTLWTYYRPEPGRGTSSADYANALARLHADMRRLDIAAPHFTERVDAALRLLASRERTPGLAEPDRTSLVRTLRRTASVVSERGAPEQLLHGEPHAGNLLLTTEGPLFIDLETCCRGPVEFDLAHAPDDVVDQYAGADRELLRACQMLVLAMITTWRWDRDDRLPDGRRLGAEWLSKLQAMLAHDGIDG